MAKLITADKIPPELQSKLNFVKKRILFISPSVACGQEKESTKDDFESLTSSTIGIGGFGKVYKVRHKISKNIYAIKVINKQKIVENNLCEQIRLEVRIMYSLNHEHIIKLNNHFEDDDNFYLVLEYAPKGHLYEKLKLMGRLPERLTAQYLREVFSAVEYLHSTNPPIIHRDIKPENILLDSKERAKLCDFGWSNFFNPSTKRMTYCGTPDYLAPEMIKKEGHDQTIDIWNLGVLMFELLTGHTPFQASNQKEIFNNILKLKRVFPKGFPMIAKDLVLKLLKANPKERITLQAALEHPWFKANPELRPVLTKQVKMETQLPTLESDLNEEDFEPVSRVSKVNREESDKRQTKGKPGIEVGTTKKSEKDDTIADLNNQLQESIKEENECKVKLQARERELEAVKKGIDDIKTKLEKSDKGYVAPDKEEIMKLKEELQRLTLINKNLEANGIKLTEESAQLVDASSQAKLLAREIETCKANNKALDDKLTEVNGKIDEMENKLSEVKSFINKEKLLKEKNTVELEGKIDELKHKLKSISANDVKEDNEKLTDEAAKNCESSLKTIKSVIETSLKKVANEENLKKELLDTYKNIAEMRMKHLITLNEKEQIQQNVIDRIKTNHVKTLKDMAIDKEKSVKRYEESIASNQKQEYESALEEEDMKALQIQATQMQEILNGLKMHVTLYSQMKNLLPEKVRNSTIEVQELERQLTSESSTNVTNNNFRAVANSISTTAANGNVFGS